MKSTKNNGLAREHFSWRRHFGARQDLESEFCAGPEHLAGLAERSRKGPPGPSGVKCRRWGSGDADAQLMLRYAAGDARAFDELLRAQSRGSVAVHPPPGARCGGHRRRFPGMLVARHRQPRTLPAHGTLHDLALPDRAQLLHGSLAEKRAARGARGRRMTTRSRPPPMRQRAARSRSPSPAKHGGGSRSRSPGCRRNSASHSFYMWRADCRWRKLRNKRAPAPRRRRAGCVTRSRG